MSEEKTYVFVKGGTGHLPHELHNANDPTDVLWLCSCGGTRDPNGYCDNAHESKEKLGCVCWYCKPANERHGKTEIDQKKCTHCE